MSLTGLSIFKAIICNSVFNSLSISNVILEMAIIGISFFLVTIILFVGTCIYYIRIYENLYLR